MEEISLFLQEMMRVPSSLQVLRRPPGAMRRDVVAIAGYPYTDEDFAIIARYVRIRKAPVHCFARGGTFVPAAQLPGEATAEAIGRKLAEFGLPTSQYFAWSCAMNTVEEVQAMARARLVTNEETFLTIVAGDLHALRFQLTLEYQAPQFNGQGIVAAPFTWRWMPSAVRERRVVQEGYRIAAYQRGSIAEPAPRIKMALTRMIAAIERERPELHAEMLAETAPYRAAHSA